MSLLAPTFFPPQSAAADKQSKKYRFFASFAPWERLVSDWLGVKNGPEGNEEEERMAVFFCLPLPTSIVLVEEGGIRKLASFKRKRSKQCNSNVSLIMFCKSVFSLIHSFFSLSYLLVD